MEIRPTVPQDLAEILEAYEYAREQMRKNGNPTQWGTARPSADTVREDILLGRSFAVTDGGVLCGVFVFLKDYDDPTYHVIKNGAWLNGKPYSVLHRVASNGRKPGVMDAILKYSFENSSNIRIDTHEKNLPMRHILQTRGFTECGIIYTDDGTERIAYQKDIG